MTEITFTTIVELIELAAIVFYLSYLVLLNTSMALRLGYNPWRVRPLSPVWPVLHISDRVNQWAKGGQCTLAEDHPLRSGEV